MTVVNQILTGVLTTIVIFPEKTHKKFNSKYMDCVRISSCDKRRRILVVDDHLKRLSIANS